MQTHDIAAAAERAEWEAKEEGKRKGTAPWDGKSKWKAVEAWKGVAPSTDASMFTSAQSWPTQEAAELAIDRIWREREGQRAKMPRPHTCPLMLDFDSSDGLLEPARDARTVVHFLVDCLEIPEPLVDIVFSGSKGFHVTVPASVFGSPADEQATMRVKTAAIFLFEHLGFKTLDFGIYSYPRQFREANTIHKSGRWCVPISYRELLHGAHQSQQDATTYFHTLAKGPRDWEYPDEERSDAKFNDLAAEWWANANRQNRPAPRVERIIAAKRAEMDLPPDLARRVFPDWVHDVVNKPCTANAHYYLLAISLDYARLGLPREAILEKVLAWDTEHTVPAKFIQQNRGMAYIESAVDGALRKVEGWRDRGKADVKKGENLAAVRERARQNNRAVLLMGDMQPREMHEAAWKALRRHFPAPLLAKQDNRLVYLERVEAGLARITKVGMGVMRHMVALSSDTYSSGRSGEMRAAEPSRNIIEQILATPPKDLPALERILYTPFFTRRGELIQDSGYHEDQRVYLELGEELKRLPTVPEKPTAEDAANAKVFIDQVIQDFPFVSDSDKAHWWAALLVPFVRSMIEGIVPALLLEAPTPRSGKGLLASVIGTIATGRPPSPMTLARDEDERKKSIFAALRSGHPILLYDNLPSASVIDSATLAAVLTAYPYFEDRVLGVSEVARVPMMSQVIFTGNNPKFSKELVPRMLRCRIDPRTDRPEERKDWAIKDLERFVKRERIKLVWAVLIIVQSWLAAGKPRWAGQGTGRFEEYGEVIGSILAYHGIRGFLENRHEFVASSDAESEMMEEFLGAWLYEIERAPSKQWGTKELATLCEEKSLLGPKIARAGTPKAVAVTIGTLLRSLKDRRFTVDGKSVMVEAAKTAANTNYYYLVVDGKETSVWKPRAPRVENEPPKQVDILDLPDPEDPPNEDKEVPF